MAKGNAMSGAAGAAMGMNGVGSGQAIRPNMSSRRPGSNMGGKLGQGGGTNLNELSGSLKDILADWNTPPTAPATNNTQPSGTGFNMFGPMMGAGASLGNAGNPFFVPNFYSQLQGNVGNTAPKTAAPPVSPAVTGGYADGNAALSHINSKLNRQLQGDEIDYIKNNVLGGYSGGALNQGQMDSIFSAIRQHKPELLAGVGI